MSDHLIGHIALPPTNHPLRVSVRRFRWLKSAFHTHVEAYGDYLGCDFVVDDEKLADAFVRWLQSIDRQKPSDKAMRRAFFEFAACLMLRELITGMPVRTVSPPSRLHSAPAGTFWPEGFVCTMFCLSVHSAAMKQEFEVDVDVSATVDDLRSWWSFKENAAENPGFPAGFLQKLMGREPNWSMPDVFRAQL